MSGIKYLFDTNAIVGLFNSNANLSQYLLPKNKINLSIVSIVEFLSYGLRTEAGKEIFLEFCEQSVVIDLTFTNSILIDSIIFVRKKYKPKLPDAIIAASAITNDAILITNDGHFANIANLQILTF